MLQTLSNPNRLKYDLYNRSLTILNQVMPTDAFDKREKPDKTKHHPSYDDFSSDDEGYVTNYYYLAALVVSFS